MSLKKMRAALTMTKYDALRIQAKQLAHYTEIYSAEAMAPVVEKIRGMTKPDELDAAEHPTWVVHRHIPCGGDIEAVMHELAVSRDRGHMD